MYHEPQKFRLTGYEGKQGKPEVSVITVITACQWGRSGEEQRARGWGGAHEVQIQVAHEHVNHAVYAVQGLVPTNGYIAPEGPPSLGTQPS